jgi:DNA-binding transcriptional LysR family regulator
MDDLRALIEVADRKSFTAAAAALRVSPSAVSQTIRALEERVGVRLLQRTTRSVGLTDAGSRFLARLRPAMAGVREAFEALGEERERPAGVLRLNVPRMAYQLLLEPRLPAFLARYPDLELELHIDDAFADIVADGFDAGVRLGEMVQRDMIGVKLGGDLEMAVVGAPAYFAAHGKPRHPRDLHAHDCINYRRRTSGSIYRWEFTERGKDLEIAVNGRVLLDDGDLMASAALAGLGLAYLVKQSIAPHLAARRLVRVLDRFCPPFPGFYLYYPSRSHLPPKLTALIAFLRAPAPRS